MTADLRAALSTLVGAFERHLEVAAMRRNPDDPSVVAAAQNLADAFDDYDELLFDTTEVTTPLAVYEGDDDDEDEDEVGDDEDDDEDDDDGDEDDDDGDEDDEDEDEDGDDEDEDDDELDDDDEDDEDDEDDDELDELDELDDEGESDQYVGLGDDEYENVSREGR